MHEFGFRVGAVPMCGTGSKLWPHLHWAKRDPWQNPLDILTSATILTAFFKGARSRVAGDAQRRTQPLLPMRPGHIERRTHDAERHGTRTLFADLIVSRKTASCATVTA